LIITKYVNKLYTYSWSCDDVDRCSRIDVWAFCTIIYLQVQSILRYDKLFNKCTQLKDFLIFLLIYLTIN